MTVVLLPWPCLRHRDLNWLTLPVLRVSHLQVQHAPTLWSTVTFNFLNQGVAVVAEASRSPPEKMQASIGHDIHPRSKTDTASGRIYCLDWPLPSGTVVSWTFHTDQTDRHIYPLVFRRSTFNTWSYCCVGKVSLCQHFFSSPFLTAVFQLRKTHGPGVHEFPFEPIAGSAQLFIFS